MNNENAIFRKAFFVSLLLLLIHSGVRAQDSNTSIPLNIKEVAGVDRNNDIISSGVPLPQGMFQNTDRFAVFDSKNKPVPAQFKVLERWIEAGQDGSIKWMLVTFLGNVKANSQTTYYLRPGKNKTPDFPVIIKDLPDEFQIGLFKIKKDLSQPFSLVLTDEKRKQFYSDNLTSIKWEIVETGPVRACIKAENLCDKDPFGFILWLYFYSGTDRCDMKVVLKNTPRTPRGPFYFRDFSVVWKTQGSDYQIGGEKGQFLPGDLEKEDTVYLYQDSSVTDRWDKL